MSTSEPKKRIEAIETEVRDLSIAISASEGWSKSWVDLGPYFQQMLGLEADMERVCRDYLRHLSQRVNSYISWTQYHKDVSSIQASEDRAKTLDAYDVNVLFDDQSFKQDEQVQVEALISEVYINGIALGFAGERYQLTGSVASVPRTVGSPIYDTILNEADTHIKQLAEWLDNHTAQEVVQSIQESIALGESQELAMQRLIRVIDSPKRAELIAQTEMVRAYSIGEETFANRNGAVDQTWEALPGADDGSKTQPCVENNGITVGLKDAFPSGDFRPPAHPRCRCKRNFHYPPGIIPLDL